MYDVNFFIDKFEKIPEEKIGEDSLSNHCALHHCGGYPERSAESLALCNLLTPISKAAIIGFAVTNINDGINPDYQQPTPKQRILAALYDIKEKTDTDNAVNAAQEILNNPCQLVNLNQ